MIATGDRVIRLEEALAEVQLYAASCSPPRTERLPLDQAAGRILGAAIRASRDQPPFDRSTRDGFAIRSADASATRRVIGLLRAGEPWTGPPLSPTEAVEIMTGAPLPPGADAVLMVEHATRSADALSTSRTLTAGENIVPQAAEARRNDVLLSPGNLIDAAAVAIAAGAGLAALDVFARPRVAILATGDELVEAASADPAPWQIYNSNSPALAALVAAAGGQPQTLPIARDHRDGPDGLDPLLAQARTSDLILLSGGVSMGRFDLVEAALADLGAEFFFTGVRIQPGKPIVFGRLPKLHTTPASATWTYFFGLPGNPVSTEVCFHLFAATLIRALSGATETAPQFVAAVAAEAFEGKSNLTRLLPCRLSSTFRETTVRPVAWQGSGDTAANARANAYCVVEPQGLAQGQLARVLLR